jgi:hypothetical protein
MLYRAHYIEIGVLSDEIPMCGVQYVGLLHPYYIQGTRLSVAPLLLLVFAHVANVPYGFSNPLCLHDICYWDVCIGN